MASMKIFRLRAASACSRGWEQYLGYVKLERKRGVYDDVCYRGRRI